MQGHRRCAARAPALVSPSLSSLAFCLLVRPSYRACMFTPRPRSQLQGDHHSRSLHLQRQLLLQLQGLPCRQIWRGRHLPWVRIHVPQRETHRTGQHRMSQQVAMVGHDFDVPLLWQRGAGQPVPWILPGLCGPAARRTLCALSRLTEEGRAQPTSAQLTRTEERSSCTCRRCSGKVACSHALGGGRRIESRIGHRHRTAHSCGRLLGLMVLSCEPIGEHAVYVPGRWQCHVYI